MWHTPSTPTQSRPSMGHGRAFFMDEPLDGATEHKAISGQTDDNVCKTCHKPSSPTPAVSVAVMGCGPCGKTSLIKRYVDGTFDETLEYTPTVEGMYKTTLRGGRMLEILDTSGCTDSSALWDYYVDAAMGFILVYSIGDWSSLDHIREFHKLILRVKGAESVPVALVGTKADTIAQSNRTVSFAQAKRLAADLGGFVGHWEVSAATGEGVQEVFECLAQKAIKKVDDKLRRGRSNSDGSHRLAQAVHAVTRLGRRIPQTPAMSPRQHRSMSLTNVMAPPASANYAASRNSAAQSPALRSRSFDWSVSNMATHFMGGNPNPNARRNSTSKVHNRERASTTGADSVPPKRRNSAAAMIRRLSHGSTSTLGLFHSSNHTNEASSTSASTNLDEPFGGLTPIKSSASQSLKSPSPTEDSPICQKTEKIDPSANHRVRTCTPGTLIGRRGRTQSAGSRTVPATDFSGYGERRASLMTPINQSILTEITSPNSSSDNVSPLTPTPTFRWYHRQISAISVGELSNFSIRSRSVSFSSNTSLLNMSPFFERKPPASEIHHHGRTDPPVHIPGLNAMYNKGPPSSPPMGYHGIHCREEWDGLGICACPKKPPQSSSSSGAVSVDANVGGVANAGGKSGKKEGNRMTATMQRALRKFSC